MNISAAMNNNEQNNDNDLLCIIQKIDYVLSKHYAVNSENIIFDTGEMANISVKVDLFSLKDLCNRLTRIFEILTCFTYFTFCYSTGRK